MNTDGRLMRAYESATNISFNNSSKFVFMSDVHRGDNSISDEFAHNQNIYYHALNHYYNEGYTYVEVGDGDELWEHSNFEHIRSAHSDVYWLLNRFHSNGRLHMLYGNHNMHFRNSAYVERNLYAFYDEYLEQNGELFPNIDIHESVLLIHEDTGQKIFVVHGHQGDLLNDHLWRVSMFWMRYFWRFMHLIGFRNPASPAKNRIKRHKIERNFSDFIRRHGIILICGHTHRPKFPNPGEVPYFNDGCCVHPRGLTGIEITEGQISLVDWRVRPDEKGALHIAKKTIRGPEPLMAYWINEK